MAVPKVKEALILDETQGPIDGVAFPFARQLSLQPIIRRWNSPDVRANPYFRALSDQINASLARRPELAEAAVEPALLEAEPELLAALLSLSVPPARQDKELVSIVVPYSDRAVYQSKAYKESFDVGGAGQNRFRTSGPAAVYRSRLSFAYLWILRSVYGLDLQTKHRPPPIQGRDDGTGLRRRYQLTADATFCDIVKTGAPDILPAAAREHILANLGDVEEWMRVLPPAWFAFRGFSVLTFADVTAYEALGEIKQELIRGEGLTKSEGFSALEQGLRLLLARPRLTLGLSYVSSPGHFVRFTHASIGRGNAADSNLWCTGGEELAGTRYAEAATRPQPTVFRGDGERQLIAPLRDRDQLLGFLDLTAGEDDSFHELNMASLDEILPLAAISLRRALDDFRTRLQSIVKERCTSIHPSVEWRFQQMAREFVASERQTGQGTVAPVVFPDVHPLFASSDIRGSSTLRNHAIQADLREQLAHADAVLTSSLEATRLPLLGELRHRLRAQRQRLDHGLLAGDELGLLGFVRSEVHPVLRHLQTLGGDVAAAVGGYLDSLSDGHGGLYRARRDLDESIQALNDAVANHLDQGQLEAQGYFPHYFEKHVTDGVDHSIYVGQALVQCLTYDPVHLKSLRLWQLRLVCESARLGAALKGSLRVPLETAHLVMVQDSPMTIRFDYDEKHFGVDGAYNIRYEIMKKRIDKAQVKGSSERMTQPGCVAVVFSQDGERDEYRQYLDYLASTGHLTGKVDELELEDLQGIVGLRALRVRIEI